LGGRVNSELKWARGTGGFLIVGQKQVCRNLEGKRDRFRLTAAKFVKTRGRRRTTAGISPLYAGGNLLVKSHQFLPNASGPLQDTEQLLCQSELGRLQQGCDAGSGRNHRHARRRV